MTKALTLIYNVIVGWTTTGGIIPSLFLVCSTLIAAATWLQTQWSLMVTKMALLTTISGSAINFSGIGLVNTFFPLTESLTLLTAYIALLGVAAIIRIIKSFIPTISS